MLDFTRRPKGFNSRAARRSFDETAATLLANARSVCKHLLPGGRLNGHEWVCGDLYGGKGRSLSVNTHTGVWKDFASGEGGGDLISLWAAVHGMHQGDAKGEAEKWLGIGDEGKAIIELSKTRAAAPSEKPTPSSDDDSWWRGRQPDKRWDYFTADGVLWGSVYRFNHPAGGPKVIRPWNPATQQWEVPEGLRPLYGLPAVLANPGRPVVLVEGEKKVDALADIGVIAVSMWGGANAARVTDWSFLEGRDVLRWPDNDPTPDGPRKVRAADSWLKLTGEALAHAGVTSVRDAVIPDGKPAKWDSADATPDERRAIVAAGWKTDPVHVGVRRLRLQDYTISQFIGPPPPRRFLVNEVIPLGVAVILAAMGDTGKGLITLDLALKVASPEPTSKDYSPGAVDMAFGCRVVDRGAAVILSAEDDLGELHRRIAAIDPNGFRRKAIEQKNLIVVPFPNRGGAMPFVRGVAGGGVQTTDEFDELKEQLRAIDDLRLIVVDPLASFVQADINADPAAGAFVAGQFATLASETGATVLLAHHMSKGGKKDPIRTAEDARHAIRGTSAIVDGVRCAYAIWAADEPEAKSLCRVLGVKWARNIVFKGAVVKSNGPADRTIRTYFRNQSSGLLEDRTPAIREKGVERHVLLEMLVEEIEEAAKAQKPFTKTGKDGLFERRNELPDELQAVAKNELPKLADELLKRGRIVRCDPVGVPGALDVPNGPYAQTQYTRKTRGARAPRLVVDNDKEGK